jgi:hypothetical protein
MRCNRIALVSPRGQTAFSGKHIDDPIDRRGACRDGFQRRVQHQRMCGTGSAALEDVLESRQQVGPLFIEPADHVIFDSKRQINSARGGELDGEPFQDCGCMYNRSDLHARIVFPLAPCPPTSSPF